jgi:hypothetical protein
VSDNYWTDARQNRQISELQDEVKAAYSYAADRSRMLQSRLSQVQGTIERRLDRLATSFDAFVELSDVRLRLAVFDRELAVRHRTRRLLIELAQGVGDPSPLDLEDCPAYWLGPAAEALAALVRGEAVSADAYATEATRRDEERATLFLTLGPVVAGRTDLAAPWLARALPSLGATVTSAQRRLWTACADGVFGESGRSHIERRLTEFFDELPDDVSEKEADQWRQAVASHTGKGTKVSLPREIQDERGLTDPPLEAGRLTSLRTLVEDALRTDDVPVSPDFGALLLTLVDEGSENERPLVARSRELLQIIEQGGAEHVAAWDTPGGDTRELLRGDLFRPNRPGPRVLAARVGARWLTEIADGLAERASASPPDELDVRVHGRQLRIGRGGSSRLAEAQAEIDQASVVSPTAERVGIAMAIAGVAVMVLTIVAGIAALAELSALVAIVGVVLALAKRFERRKAREAAEQDKSRLARQVQTIADSLETSQSRHKDRVATAAADRETIVTLLT